MIIILDAMNGYKTTIGLLTSTLSLIDISVLLM